MSDRVLFEVAIVGWEGHLLRRGAVPAEVSCVLVLDEVWKVVIACGYSFLRRCIGVVEIFVTSGMGDGGRG